MSARIEVTPLGSAPDVAGALARLADLRGLVALDGGASPARTSVIAFEPRRDAALAPELAGLRALAARLAPRDAADVPGDFAGGFAGALAYDLGVEGERRTWAERDPWGSPRVAGGLYTDFLVLDERERRGWLALDRDASDGRAPLAERRAALLARLAGAAPELAPARARGALTSHVPAAEHRARVAALRERIAAGDLYQANLARRFTQALAGDPLELYLRLRRVNPAPWMGYLAWDASTRAGGTLERGALLSASPELLLEFDGRSARTRPIKGTAPRGVDAAADARLAAGLLASAKDRAELAMIVDLERNDLGRCARPGGVRVEGFPRLESYASVHHLVADVVAEIRPGLGAFDVLAALFPGGSISGAPKLAAMRAIAELEGEGRGFFTGSLGFVDARGRARWNVLIRTLVWRPLGSAGEVSFYAGGGITWGSDPEAEERETLHKAAGLVRALEGAG